VRDVAGLVLLSGLIRDGALRRWDCVSLSRAKGLVGFIAHKNPAVDASVTGREVVKLLLRGFEKTQSLLPGIVNLSRTMAASLTRDHVVIGVIGAHVAIDADAVLAEKRMSALEGIMPNIDLIGISVIEHFAVRALLAVSGEGSASNAMTLSVVFVSGEDH
jgi:hypothetical protein